LLSEFALALPGRIIPHPLRPQQRDVPLLQRAWKEWRRSDLLGASEFKEILNKLINDRGAIP